MYKHNNFLEILNKNFKMLNKKRLYSSGDLNMNMHQEKKYAFLDNNAFSSKFLSDSFKNYHKFIVLLNVKFNLWNLQHLSSN